MVGNGGQNCRRARVRVVSIVPSGVRVRRGDSSAMTRLN